MPAADLTTTAAVKAFANVTGSGSDSIIDGIVTACAAWIHSQVGHDYNSDARTEKFDGGHGAVVLSRPAASITSVSESGTTLAASAYELDAVSPRLLWRKDSMTAVGTWAQATRGITVVYVPVSTVPADLELAARMVCAFVLKQGGFDGGGARLGLGSQANADTGQADYFVQALSALPFARDVIRRYAVTRLV